MTKTSDEKSSKLKPYQMILLSCLLGTFLIINSNYVNYNRDLAKLNKEKGELFDNIIKTRRLSTGNSYSVEVCSRASDDLKEYYQTGDPNKIDVDPNKGIECEDKDKAYMKALINIVRTMADDSEDDSNPNPSPDGRRRNLRNLGGASDIDQQDLTDYGMRFLPMGVFLVFGILSIFGWIFCCICCCCDCCCCCCFKKPSCKIPCFIFTYVFYGLVVAISIYGLVQANKIFVGLADTECSMLKFFDQVLQGEMKQTKPRWAGIEQVKTLLTNIKASITTLGSGTKEELNLEMDNTPDTSKPDGLKQIRDRFIGHIQQFGGKFYDSGAFKTPYLYQTNYVYDVVYGLGRYENSQGFTPSNSYLYLWNQEFSAIDGAAYGYLTNAENDFNDILGSSFGDIKNALDDGAKNLDDLTSPFTDANDQIGKIFSNFSESIDSYGKMSVNIIFGGLMAMNVALAALMLLICMFSGKSCTSCCCCRCLFKFATHILWNVLALLMILSFILGSLIALLGRLGGDAMGLVSYIMSIDNFNGTKPILVNKLDKAKDYIYTCMHGDGDIAKQLGLGTSLNSFTGINDVQNNISAIITNFTVLKNSEGTYSFLKKKLENQLAYKEDITLIHLQGEAPISANKLIQEINRIADANGGIEKWSNTSNYAGACETSTLSAAKIYHPKNCQPKNAQSYHSVAGYDAKADLLYDIDEIARYAGDSTTSISPSVAPKLLNELDTLHGEYDGYLEKYIRILNLFLKKIKVITDVIRPFIGNGQAFSFINGRFIGINLKIILKYFEQSLGGDFFTVGICLCVVGLSLILSISSTIILIVIINIGLKQAIEQNQMQNNINNVGPVVSQFEGVPNMLKPPY